VPVTLYGPRDQGVGPREVYQTLMQPPYFPVDWHEVGSHIRCVDIAHPNSTVLVVHPEGGWKVLTVEAFERVAQNGTRIKARRQVPVRAQKNHLVSLNSRVSIVH
jgi:hypothetical protein